MLFRVPHDHLARVRIPQHACHLMDADIWGVVARRVGSEAFLRRALPLLLAWLERGVQTETDGTPRCRATKTPSAAVAAEQVAEEGADDTAAPRVREEGQRGGVTLAPERVPPRSRASGEVTTSEGSAQAKMSSWDASGGRGDDGVGEPDMSVEGGEDLSASRVQVAASACVSQDVFECLGERHEQRSSTTFREVERAGLIDKGATVERLDVETISLQAHGDGARRMSTVVSAWRRGDVLYCLDNHDRSA